MNGMTKTERECRRSKTLLQQPNCDAWDQGELLE